MMKVNIDTQDDALRKVMLRMKEQREVPRLSEDFEDRVMAKIEAEAIKPQRQKKVVRLWVLRAVSAAAVLAGLFFLVETLMPNGEKEEKIVAKVEMPKPQTPVIVKEEAVFEVPEEKPVATPVHPTKPKQTKANPTTPIEEIAEEDIEDHAPLTAHDGLLAMQDMSQRLNDLRKQHETNPNTGTPYEDFD